MYAKIIVPIDGSATSTAGLAEALRLAKLCGARLKLLHIVDLQSFSMYSNTALGLTPEVFDQLHQGGEQILAQGRASAEAAGVPVETELHERFASRVSDTVIEQAQAWGAELIVLGTHGRRGLGRALLGSDAEQIVRHASVPVLLVRGAA